MNKWKAKAFLIITFSLIFILPLLGSVIRWKGFPPGYGEFPVQKVMTVPGFNLVYFTAASIVSAFIAVFIAFPKHFGFKKLQNKKANIKGIKFPHWFWWSLPTLGISWYLMWAKVVLFVSLHHYTFVPLWWSFIFILDGIVYKRNNGISLISSKPRIMQILAVVSCFSWFVFEYLNFFVLENWYYPNNNIFTNFGNIFWFSLSYTTVLPAIFEWYILLKTFNCLRNRYQNGPKFSISKKFLKIFYLLGFALAFGMGYYPYKLFWVLWVALIPLLSAGMGATGYWTPFTPIKEGNWSPTILIGLATLLNGFFWEFWNFGSESNPNYWRYSVPYLDKIHIFSQMPILGYFGYLFFGVNCWIMWLAAAYVFEFDCNFDVTEDPISTVIGDIIIKQNVFIAPNVSIRADE